MRSRTDSPHTSTFRLKIAAGIVAMLLVMLAFAAPAFAQSEPSPEDIERAQRHYEQGVALYAAGDYPKAIVEFLKGYNYAKNAMFLYNVSLSYGRLGRYSDALNAAIRAEQDEGMPPEVQVRNDARIAALHIVVDAPRKAKRIKAAAEPEVAAAEERVVPDPDPQPEPTPQPEPRKGMSAAGWTGTGLAVVGAGLLTSAAFVNAGVSRDLEVYKQAASRGDAETYYRLNSEIKDAQRLGLVLAGTGGVAAATGLMLVLVDLMTAGAEASPAPTAWIAPAANGVTAGFRCQF